MEETSNTVIENKSIVERHLTVKEDGTRTFNVVGAMAELELKQIKHTEALIKIKELLEQLSTEQTDKN